MENQPLLSVSDFVALTNQTLETAYPLFLIEGEVAEFKISQGKWVHFKLKDADSSVECFMTSWQLRTQIEDGMKIIVQGSPKLTKWGKFSVTVQSLRQSGEGSIKKGFELLKAKLEKEGLFSEERKRLLPRLPKRVAVVASVESAGYKDFIKILNQRWGGMEISVAHVQVQGVSAPDQMIRAIRHINSEETLPEVLVVVRGGGSAEDLAAFNDEPLVRVISESRVPTLIGVGHEVDITLADLVADKRASTPSNAAQILVPDRSEVISQINQQTAGIGRQIVSAANTYSEKIKDSLFRASDCINDRVAESFDRLSLLKMSVSQVNPQSVLKRGYALLRGEIKKGSIVEIDTFKQQIKAEVKDVKRK